MRIGIVVLPVGGEGVGSVLAQIEQVEQHGFASLWMSGSSINVDALTVLALATQCTTTIELATFVVPTYPRHPAALAQQALTVQAACGGRLTLGIGLSHRAVMHDRLGFDWDHPIRHMREYLATLTQLLRQEVVHFEGEEFTIRDFQLMIGDAPPPSVLVGALGPQMLRLTGGMADGTAIWMGGPRYIAERVVPTINDAARKADRSAPRIVAGLPVCVTNRAVEVRARAAQAYQLYSRLPSYRAILNHEGVLGPADVALIGNGPEVRAGLQSLADAGVTDFAALVFASDAIEHEATIQVLAEATTS